MEEVDSPQMFHVVKGRQKGTRAPQKLRKLPMSAKVLPKNQKNNTHTDVCTTATASAKIGALVNTDVWSPGVVTLTSLLLLSIYLALFPSIAVDMK